MYLSTTLFTAATALAGSAFAAPYSLVPTGYSASSYASSTSTPCSTKAASHLASSYAEPSSYAKPSSYAEPSSAAQPSSYANPGSYITPSTSVACHGPKGAYCLSDSDAQDAADIFQELIQNYSDELALAALTEDFVDYSSAVNIIINGGDDEPMKLPGPTFVGRQAFMDGQGSQPKIPFKQLKVWHGCDHVSMRWLTKRSAKGQETETDDEPVVGNVIIETVKAEAGAKYNFRIKTIYSEFNAAAWLVNLGVFTPVETSEEKRSLGANLRGNMI